MAAASAAKLDDILDGTGGTGIKVSTIEATGTTTLTGAVSLGSTLGVTGAVTLSSTLATGAVTLSGLAVTNALSVGTTTTLTGAVSLGSTLGITGAATFTGGIVADITGNLSGSVGSVTTKTGYALANTGADLVLKSSTFALAMADAVWDELLAGHTTADTSGLVLNEWQDGGRLDLILDIIAADTTTDIPALIATAQADLDIITGATGVNLLAATQASIDAIETDTTTDIPALIATAQADLDIITGATGVNLLAATQASIDAIEADTNELQGDWTNNGRLDLIVDAILVDTATTLQDQIVLILEDTATTIPATITTLAADVATVDGIVDSILIDTSTTLHNNIVLILEDTGTTIPASLTTIDNEIAVIDGIVDTILLDTGTDGVLVSSAGLTAIVNAVWDATMASHVGAGTTGYALNAAGVAADPWATALPGAYGAGTAGKIIGDIVDDVWDEEITAGHTAADSAGAALNAAGVGADPWTIALPGAYGAGTAGKIIGDNINASLTTILADTNELQAAWVDGGRLDLLLDIAATQWAIALPGAYAAGTAGYIVGTYLDAAVSSVSTATGSGAISHTITVTVSGTPIDNVRVWISTDAAGSNVVAGTIRTNSSGQVTFTLDAGTYYSWFEHGSYNFSNPQTETVA